MTMKMRMMMKDSSILLKDLIVNIITKLKTININKCLQLIILRSIDKTKSLLYNNSINIKTIKIVINMRITTKNSYNISNNNNNNNL